MVLGGRALGGWLLGVVAQRTSTRLANILTAFLGGAVLFNVCTDELPADRYSSLGWFTTGLAVYAALITAATVAAGTGAA